MAPPGMRDRNPEPLTSAAANFKPCGIDGTARRPSRPRSTRAERADRYHEVWNAMFDRTRPSIREALKGQRLARESDGWSDG